MRDGDVVLALASSGLHSNGCSLVRHVLATAGIGFGDTASELGGVVGEVLLEPTRLYTTPLLDVLAQPELGPAVHSISHVTGGGIAANLARVLPRGSFSELERSTWSPPAVFRALAGIAGSTLETAEGPGNLGIGMIAVWHAAAADGIARALSAAGIPTWEAGRVTIGDAPVGAGFEQGAKGVDGGAVRLTGRYRD